MIKSSIATSIVIIPLLLLSFSLQKSSSMFSTYIFLFILTAFLATSLAHFFRRSDRTVQFALWYKQNIGIFLRSLTITLLISILPAIITVFLATFAISIFSLSLVLYPVFLYVFSFAFIYFIVFYKLSKSPKYSDSTLGNEQDRLSAVFALIISLSLFTAVLFYTFIFDVKNDPTGNLEIVNSEYSYCEKQTSLSYSYTINVLESGEYYFRENNIPGYQSEIYLDGTVLADKNFQYYPVTLKKGSKHNLVMNLYKASYGSSKTNWPLFALNASIKKNNIERIVVEPRFKPLYVPSKSEYSSCSF